MIIRLSEFGYFIFFLLAVIGICMFTLFDKREKYHRLVTALFIAFSIGVPILSVANTKIYYDKEEEIVLTVTDKETVGSPRGYRSFFFHFGDDICIQTSQGAYNSTNVGDSIYVYKITTYKRNRSGGDDTVKKIKYKVKTQPIETEENQ